MVLSRNNRKWDILFKYNPGLLKKLFKGRVMDEKAIVKALFKYIPCPDIDKEPGKADFSEWDISKEAKKLIAEDPNAFLFGAIFNRLIFAEEAWERPYQLKQRLGHLELKKIAKISHSDLALEIGPKKHGKALHWLYNDMARGISFASNHLINKYKGNANNIWSTSESSDVVRDRLLEFYGIGQKISNMVLTFLIK
jgi:hypothetical protein